MLIPLTSHIKWEPLEIITSQHMVHVSVFCLIAHTHAYTHTHTHKHIPWIPLPIGKGPHPQPAPLDPLDLLAHAVPVWGRDDHYCWHWNEQQQFKQESAQHVRLLGEVDHYCWR